MIETERLLLRTQAADDFDVWMRDINTPAVREYLGGLETPEEVAAVFERAQRSQRTEGFSFWFIEEKASGRLLGCCGLKRVDTELAPALLHQMEIGWLLREDSWGRGYGFEAAAASLDFVFARPDFDRVYALTSRSNAASWKLMDKLGMSHLPEHDFVDPDFPPRDNPTAVYCLTRDQWESQE